jgi:hypothetical protein
MTLTRKMEQFRKTSSSEAAVDPGNSIVAIRRLALVVDDYDSDQEPIKRRIDYVEIELFSDIAPPALNSGYVIRIGAREFLPAGRGCGINTRCVMVVMTPAVFETLNDGDLVSMRNGVGSSPQELVAIREGGEPATVVGAKFGRLLKSMIDRFPAVERASTDN